MTINSTNPNTVDNSNAQQAPSPATQSRDTGWSFHKKNPYSRTPIGRGIGSEAMIRLHTALTEEYLKADSSFQIKLISLDNANEAAYFSSLIVVLTDRNSPKTGVAFHTLIVEASGDEIPPKIENINGQNIEIIRVAGDSYDNTLMAMILDRVRSEYPNTPCFNTTATVIPRNFNTEDKLAVHNLALNTGLAMSTELETRRSDFEDINLTKQANDSKLIVGLTFSNQQIENGTGDPVRADIGVTFTSQQTRWQNNQSMNSDERAMKVASLAGFIDLVYSPTAPQRGMFNAYANQPAYGQVQNQNVATQKYSARFVVTHMQSDYVSTAPGQLLSLVSALAVGAEGNWMQALRPTHHAGKRINMQDIGIIGIEMTADEATGTFGKRFDTNSDSFRPEHLGQLITAAIRPGMILSMDVPECGAETWYTSIFAAASNGSIEAAEALSDAANHLTNGAFGRHYPIGTPMFTDNGQRVHLGYYVDESGNRRDIRDIGYVAVANLIGERDPMTLRDWSDTFTRTDFSMIQRLAARKKIITGLLPDARITGFATRVTFRQQFTDALAVACKEAGLSMAINTPMNSGDLNNTRGVANFVNDALIPMGTASVFNQNQGAMPVGMGYNTFNPRWSR